MMSSAEYLIVDHKALIPAQRERVLDWLERVDQRGLSMSLQEMEKILNEAPAEARRISEYHYLRGLLDGRFLSEELR